MDGATSNFVGVQNSFETAEAGCTGVCGRPGLKGRPHCCRVIDRTLISRFMGHGSEKHGVDPRDLRVNLLSRRRLDRAPFSLWPQPAGECP